MENDKYTELDEELIEMVIDYFDENEIPDKIFQIMEDLVFPLLRTLEWENLDTDNKLMTFIDEKKINDKALIKINKLTCQLNAITKKH
jgi:hypothetical protein